jgi:hypothetical protein
MGRWVLEEEGARQPNKTSSLLTFALRAGRLSWSLSLSLSLFVCGRERRVAAQAVKPKSLEGWIRNPERRYAYQIIFFDEINHPPMLSRRRFQHVSLSLFLADVWTPMFPW